MSSLVQIDGSLGEGVSIMWAGEPLDAVIFELHTLLILIDMFISQRERAVQSISLSTCLLDLFNVTSCSL